MFYRFNTVTKKLGSYPTFDAAQDTGNPQPIFSTEGELFDAKVISLGDMALIYNQFAAKPVTKFSDREAAARRTWAVVCGQDLGDVGNPSEGAQIVEEVQKEMADEQANEPTEPTDEQAPPAVEPTTRGRKKGTGEFAGKTVFALKQANPRRIGTAGFNSFEIIRGKPEGVPYADYIAAGGRPNDLRWDIERKWAEVK